MSETTQRDGGADEATGASAGRGAAGERGNANAEAGERLVRLEERAAFADHDVEQLSGELVKAFGLIDRLSARLASLEARLRTVESRTASDEEGDDRALQPPPHSASADERAAIDRLDRG